MKKESADQKNSVTDTCNSHENHEHQHGETCGCKSIKHGDHIDYVHDGHLHRIHDDHVDECDGENDAKETVRKQA